MKKAKLDLNARRKLRYRMEPAYREHVVSTKRQRYRKQRAVKVRNCLERKKLAHVYGRTRTVDTSAGPRTLLTYNAEEIASLLGYSDQIVRQWQRQHKFPRGPYPVVNSRIPYCVFSQEQALRLLEIMGAHQRTNQYLYDSDVATIKALMAVVPQTTRTAQHHGHKEKGATRPKVVSKANHAPSQKPSQGVRHR